MANSVTLLNVDEGIYSDDKVIDASTFSPGGRSSEWSVKLQRLRGGMSDGVDVVWLDNGLMKLAVIPTRGMSIWKGSIAGVPLGWNSPVERPVHPSFIDEMRRGGIGWLDGFNELICRCGLGWNGAPGNEVIKDADGNVVSEQFLPLHGRVANLSAHEVRIDVTDDGEITLIGVVDEASMFGGKLRLSSKLTTRVGSNTFEIQDTVQNLGSASADVEMLYHCNFGRPFLGEGATFHTAATEVAPRNVRAAEDVNTWETYADAVAGYEEQVYFTKPIADADGRGAAVLRSPDGSKAVLISFDLQTLPWLTQWKNTQADEDGYCTGLEPGTGFPNLRSFEREHGRVVSLASQQEISFDLSFSVSLHSDDVARIVSDVEALQAGHNRTVHPDPKTDWSQ